MSQVALSISSRTDNQNGFFPSQSLITIDDYGAPLPPVLCIPSGKFSYAMPLTKT